MSPEILEGWATVLEVKPRRAWGLYHSLRSTLKIRGGFLPQRIAQESPDDLFGDFCVYLKERPININRSDKYLALDFLRGITHWRRRDTASTPRVHSLNAGKGYDFVDKGAENAYDAVDAASTTREVLGDLTGPERRSVLMWAGAKTGDWPTVRSQLGNSRRREATLQNYLLRARTKMVRRNGGSLTYRAITEDAEARRLYGRSRRTLDRPS